MAGREGLSEPDRWWIAAALAHLGVDYAGNAERIRQALPEALGQAQWLQDEESIRAIAGFISGSALTSTRAARTLEAIGTETALEALTSRINAMTIEDTGHFQDLCGAAARLAGKLKHPGAVYWTNAGATVSAVRAWFRVSQRVESAPDRVSSLDTVTKDLVMARKVWIAEASRRLDLAATGKAEPYEYHIPAEALWGAKALYGPELAPILERIAAESDATASFEGASSTVKYYNIRSLAAGILTDKTGQLHAFVDVDGRTHAGGWNPSHTDLD
jgi:hypothetical protein